MEDADSSPYLGAAGLVLLALFAIVIYNYGRQFQLAKKRAQTEENLKRISLALHQYHEEYNSFPPAYVLGDDNERWHSWRVLILPYLGDSEKQLYSQLKRPVFLQV